ncbi:MAG: hypothetical protein DME54_11330 [Verrucomicrobia bacterium]|nr:MAG: hypothetical protein DME92_05965 [Verrucomicrobiota bacterium]PYK33639.1 MAG: hypothetical protein DME54_11330 [Verrucomicrobiota bacterium]
MCKCNRNFDGAAAGTVQPESGLRFTIFQSIDTAWDNSIVYEPSANGDELICSVRRQHCEPARRGPGQANIGQKRSPRRLGSFHSNGWNGRPFAGRFGRVLQCRSALVI